MRDRDAAEADDLASPDDGRLTVVALDGIPEIRQGDDLVPQLGDALDRTTGLLPHRTDVLVRSPRRSSRRRKGRSSSLDRRAAPDAIALPTWDRDARQVEVVLPRSSPGRPDGERRGHHGDLARFICANGGSMRSNVGPDSGQVVTLLPVDPDASATAIRRAIQRRFGSTCR